MPVFPCIYKGFEGFLYQVTMLLRPTNKKLG